MVTPDRPEPRQGMQDTVSPHHPLSTALHDYLARWPAEHGCVAHFIELVETPGDPYVRERLAGHLTASSLLVSADGGRTLLTHHRKLGLWLQPGGHADGDRDLGRVALREAEEETGLRPDAVTPLKVLDPIDISRTGFAVHPVLAYWHEPHDLRAMDPNETADVLPVRISDLVDPANRIRVGWESWNGPAGTT